MQCGGFLEPVQTVPKFHYTQSDARKTWTKMIYPYAPYFFNMFREIPWAEWKYEDDELIAECPTIPYVIVGGSSCEIFDKQYGSQLSPKVRLHANTDPTGDIDVKIASIRIKPKVIATKSKSIGKKIKQRNYTYFQADNTMEPYTRSYALWLLDHIESYFKSLSYNFAEWFPTAADFVYGVDSESHYADKTTARTVGPFHIYLVIFPPDDEEGPRLKIQVSMAYKTSSNQTRVEHMIEFIFGWEDPVTFDNPHPHVYIDKLGLYLTTPGGELQRNKPAITTRIYLIDNPEKVHKLYNHFGRAIFLINLINLPEFYETLSAGHRKIVMSLYKNTVKDTAVVAPAAALLMLQNCPKRLQNIPDFYSEYKKVCEHDLHLTLEECGLEEVPKKGGKSKAYTRKHKSKRRLTQKNKIV